MNVALYARYSSDNQREASIEQANGEVGLACSGRPHDEHRPAVARNSGGVDGFRRKRARDAHARSTAGSEMMKRAPEGASSRS